MFKRKIKSKVTLLFLLGVVFGYLGTFSSFVLLSSRRSDRDKIMLMAKKTMPFPKLKGAPVPSDAAILLAMKRFNISLPEGVNFPVYDETLTDRGNYLSYGLTERGDVLIGPSAFSSWGLLGSTLAHEIEVHARQDRNKIEFLNFLKDDQGYVLSEREAYLYEIKNAIRFKLTPEEMASIKEVLDHDYPLPPGSTDVPLRKYQWE